MLSVVAVDGRCDGRKGTPAAGSNHADGFLRQTAEGAGQDDRRAAGSGAQGRGADPDADGEGGPGAQ